MSAARWKRKKTVSKRTKSKTIAYYEALLLELGVSYEIEKRSAGKFNRVIITTQDDKFDSGLECYCYYRFKQENITFDFQTKIVLQERIKINKENQYIANDKVQRTIPAITLTPDFIVYQNGIEWYIDTKGQETQQNRLRFKMLEYKLLTEVKTYKILLPKSATDVEEVITRLLDK